MRCLNFGEIVKKKMSKINFYIQKEFDEDGISLYLKDNGYDVFSDFEKREGSSIAYGTIQFCKKLEMNGMANSIIGDFYFLHCRNYYHTISDLLLSDDYRMKPFGDIRRTEKFPFFLRPDSPYKPFAGGVINDEFDFKSILSAPDELCVVGGVKKIISEDRILVINGEVKFSRRYAQDGKFLYENSFKTPEKSPIEFVEKVVLPRVIDYCDCIVVDIAKVSENEYKLIEFNAPSCSGFYGEDKEVIVNSFIESLNY